MDLCVLLHPRRSSDLFLHFGRNAVALFFDLYAIFIRENVVEEGFDSAGRFALGVHVFIAPDFVSAIVGVFQSRCHAVDRKSCHVFVIDKVWKSDIADSTLGLCDALDQCTAIIGFRDLLDASS